jgi:hypothetical protein
MPTATRACLTLLVMVPRHTRLVRLFVPLEPDGVDPTSGELLIEYPVK